MLHQISCVGLCRFEILRNALDHTGLVKFVFLVQYMLVMWYTTHFFFNRRLLLVHLLESGEFLNVGLFCRVSCCHARDACLFLSQCLLFFFFFLFDIFIYFFFLYEMDAFSEFIHFFLEKLLYFNGCYST